MSEFEMEKRGAVRTRTTKRETRAPYRHDVILRVSLLPSDDAAPKAPVDADIVHDKTSQACLYTGKGGHQQIGDFFSGVAAIGNR